MNYKIYVVEDDEVIATMIERRLQAWNYQVKITSDFQQVKEEFISYDPQLVILDITLPFFNGYHWCQEIRKISEVPVLFVSSAYDQMNQVMAMNMGGDDFIAKPFDMEILLAKVQALLRRTYDFHQTSTLIPCGKGFFNQANGVLQLDDKQAELTKNESKILVTLLMNSGKIVLRNDLMLVLWNSDEYIDENTLTVNVARLRTTLSNLGLGDLIKTRKGEGYIIE